MIGFLRNIVVRVQLAVNPSNIAATVNQIQTALQNAFNTTPAVQGVQTLSGALGTFTRRAVGMVAAITGIRMGLRALAQGLTQAVTAFVEFDKKLQEGVAIMDGVDSFMRDKLGKTAIQLSKEVAFSAKEIAAGYHWLASAGLNAKQSIEAIPLIALFAKAGMMDLAEATQTLVTANAAIGYSSTDARENLAGLVRVADALTKGNQLSTASVEQLTIALNNKAATAARQAGKDIEETVAVLSLFHKQGVTGSVAGERFAIVLRQLASAATRKKEAWKAMGIEIFDSHGKMKNMAEVADELTKVFGRLSPRQQAMALQQLGIQVRTSDAVRMLIGQGDAIREYEKALRSSTGFTKEVAEKQQDTWIEKWKLLRARVMDAVMALGKSLIPVVDDLIKWVGNENGGVIKAIKGFSHWIQDNHDKIKFWAVNVAWLVMSPIKAFRLFADIINMAVAPALGLLGATFGIILAPTYLFAQTMLTLLNVVTMGRMKERIDGWRTSLDEFGKGIANFSVNNFKSAIASFKETFRIGGDDKPDARGAGKRLIDSVFDGLPKVKQNEDEVGTDDDTISDIDPRKTSARASRIQALRDQMNAALAQLTETPTDNALTKVKRLEREFKEIFGEKLPQDIRDGLDRMEEAANREDMFAGLKNQLDLIDKDDTGFENTSNLMTLIDKMKQEAAGLDQSTALYQKYAEAIRAAEEALEDLGQSRESQFEKERNERERVRHQWREWWERSVREPGRKAAETVAWAFERAFTVMISGTKRAKDAWTILGASILSAMAGGLGSFAMKKAKLNAAEAAEQMVRGFAALVNPLTASQAPGYFAAAAKYGGIATMWAGLAGGAAAASSAASGAQSDAFSARDSTGDSVRDSSTRGGDINIYIDGVDPNNPKHQQLIGDTTREYYERYGGQVIVKPYSKP